MHSFVVEGFSGKARLEGEVAIPGAKNAALPLLAAALVVPGETQFSNVPAITDVDAMSTLLESVGAYVTCNGGTCSVRAHDVAGSVLDATTAKRLRASILLVGAVLARTGTVTFPHPGGCVLGSRPIDLFVDGFEKLGCTVSEEKETYTITAPHGIQGGEIFFRTMSVTATETFIIAATAASAPVTLKNCAMEPEIEETASFLKRCGARIEGAGTPTIVVYPSHLEALKEATPVLADRIAAGSFLIFGAALGKDVSIVNANAKHVEALIEALREMGVSVTVSENTLHVSRPQKLLPLNIRTHEYPGFPTDLQAPMAVLLTQAEGESSVLETVFDGRLNYTQELVRMGANISVVNPHKALIKGPTALKARDIDGPDIRAGLAFLLAAALADGTSNIGNAHLIDRGYEDIEQKLKNLGLSIKRLSV